MALIPLLAMVRKDLQLFFSDRRAVIMSFVVPIAIASFFGSIFSGPSDNGEPARIPVAIVDQDGSAISKAIVAGAQADRNLQRHDADGETRRATPCGAARSPSPSSSRRVSATPSGGRSSATARSRSSTCSTTRRAASSWRWCAAS